MGSTTISPANSGIIPSTSDTATINPQSAVAPGLRRATASEVASATGTPTGRSISNGTDTRLTQSTTAAKTKPTPNPARIIVQPALVVNASRNKASRLS